MLYEAFLSTTGIAVGQGFPSLGSCTSGIHFDIVLISMARRSFHSVAFIS
jgi:hypothetical protein